MGWSGRIASGRTDSEAGMFTSLKLSPGAVDLRARVVAVN